LYHSVVWCETGMRRGNGGLCKGSYVLLLKNNRARKITVGKLGVPLFCKGFYAYIGSMFGPGGLEARIKRHLCSKKRKHWHVDYVLKYMRVEAVYILPGKDLESHLSRRAVKLYDHFKGFGCSDKIGDKSHLIYLKNRGEVKEFTRLLACAGFKKHKVSTFS